MTAGRFSGNSRKVRYNQQPFTVREGETMFDIARELEAAKFMRAGDFVFAGAIRG